MARGAKSAKERILSQIETQFDAIEQGWNDVVSAALTPKQQSTISEYTKRFSAEYKETKRSLEQGHAEDAESGIVKLAFTWGIIAAHMGMV